DQLQVAATGRVDEAVDVEPLVLGPPRADRAPAPHGPDATGDRLEAHPRLILGPELDPLVGVLAAQLGNPPVRGVFSRPAARRRSRPWGGGAAAPGAG